MKKHETKTAWERSERAWPPRGATESKGETHSTKKSDIGEHTLYAFGVKVTVKKKSNKEGVQRTSHPTKEGKGTATNLVHEIRASSSRRAENIGETEGLDL